MSEKDTGSEPCGSGTGLGALFPLTLIFAGRDGIDDMVSDGLWRTSEFNVLIFYLVPQSLSVKNKIRYLECWVKGANPLEENANRSCNDSTVQYECSHVNRSEREEDHLHFRFLCQQYDFFPAL